MTMRNWAWKDPEEPPLEDRGRTTLKRGTCMVMHDMQWFIKLFDTALEKGPVLNGREEIQVDRHTRTVLVGMSAQEKQRTQQTTSL